MASPRVLPLTPLELDTDQQRFVARFSDRKGRYPNIFGVLCRNLPLLEAWSRFGLYYDERISSRSPGPRGPRPSRRSQHRLRL